MRLGCCGSMISPANDPIGIDIVQPLAKMGFDYIELSLADMTALPRQDFEHLARRIEDCGIPCDACNNFFPPRLRLTGPDADLGAAIDYATGAMDRAARLGASIIVFGSAAAKNVPAGFGHAQALDQIAALLGSLGPIAAARQITLAIEPLNRRESNIVNSAAQGLELVERVGHPNVQLLIDYYHLSMENEDLAIIGRAGGAIRHVHFAQVEGRAFPTDWNEDFPRFFGALRNARYAHRCSIEAYTRDFAIDAPKALRMLRQLTSTALQGAENVRPA